MGILAVYSVSSLKYRRMYALILKKKFTETEIKEVKALDQSFTSYYPLKK